MGYFVTKITVKKTRKKAEAGRRQEEARLRLRRRHARKDLTAFTRQLSILQDAGLPILRSLRILAGQAKPGRLKYSLEDTCEEIEAGATLSEAMAKSPKCFNRLYVNMIKAGEAGGALEAHSPASGRLPGTSRIAQAQSQRRDDLPGRRRHRGRRHLDVHHDQDRARVSRRSSTTSTSSCRR